MSDYEEFRVRTENPEALDATIQQIGPCVVVAGSFDGEFCTVRAFSGCAGFVRFAIEHQGYGEIVEGEAVERMKRLTPSQTRGEHNRPAHLTETQIRNLRSEKQMLWDIGERGKR